MYENSVPMFQTRLPVKTFTFDVICEYKRSDFSQKLNIVRRHMVVSSFDCLHIEYMNTDFKQVESQISESL